MEDNNSLVPGFDSEADNYLKISLQRLNEVENAVLISLNGYIDTYNSVFFQDQIKKLINAGFTRLVFNCKNLSYVSSTGIASFTIFLKLIRPKGGDIVLLEIQPKVYDVFQLLGFSQLFNVMNSVEEAIAYFQPNFQHNSVFPRDVNCPSCNKQLRASKAGRFRCSGCKSIIVINESGLVSLE